MKIQDATGTSKWAKVDEENRIVTRSIASPLDEHINEKTGKVWSLPFENVTPTGADDFIFYITNTGDKSLRITDIRISAGTAATQVKVEKVTGTPSGGTTLTPVSRNLGRAATPSATIETGSDITGITSQGTLFYIQCDTVDREEHLRTSSNIIITKGSAVALQVETATSVMTGVVSIVEVE